MLRAALAKEVALWRSQFGMYIAFTRNDFNRCFTAAFFRVQASPCMFVPCCFLFALHMCLLFITLSQEQLLAELIANPVPPPPEPLEMEVAAAVPPHMVDGVEITMQDLMVTENEDAMKDADLSAWLDEREWLGFKKMADTKATGLLSIDEATVRTLARKYRADKDALKCRGNAITRSCAFTGAFVILECGRRILYRECPGGVKGMLMRQG